MDIDWLGHACIRVRSRGASLVMDPFAAVGDIALPKIACDVVTVSHDHPGHNAVGELEGEPFVIHGPGEYEARGVFVVGVRTSHDGRDGEESGMNTAYCATVEHLSVCHLGDIGHVPSQAQVDALGPVDVLLLPVGGGRAISPAGAAEIVSRIDPRIVVPIHFRSAYCPELEPVDRFLKELAVDEPTEETVLRLAQGRLPDQTEVILLTPALDAFTR